MQRRLWEGECTTRWEEENVGLLMMDGRFPDLDCWVFILPRTTKKIESAWNQNRENDAL